MTIGTLLGAEPIYSTYEPRTYRDQMESQDLVSYKVTLEESDLFISTDKDLSFTALQKLEAIRTIVKDHIKKEPEFVKSLSPLKIKSTDQPLIVKMKQAAKNAGVGPMAAIAGAVAEEVGKELMKASQTVIVENGGDLFIHTHKERVIGIYAGPSHFSNKIGLKVKANATLGICTSAGSFGHSLSFGCADAAIAISKCAYIADASATSIGNQVASPLHVESAVTFGSQLPQILGVVVVKGDKVGAWGDVELISL